MQNWNWWCVRCGVLYLNWCFFSRNHDWEWLRFVVKMEKNGEKFYALCICIVLGGGGVDTLKTHGDMIKMISPWQCHTWCRPRNFPSNSSTRHPHWPGGNSPGTKSPVGANGTAGKPGTAPWRRPVRPARRTDRIRLSTESGREGTQPAVDWCWLAMQTCPKEVFVRPYPRTLPGQQRRISSQCPMQWKFRHGGVGKLFSPWKSAISEKISRNDEKSQDFKRVWQGGINEKRWENRQANQSMDQSINQSISQPINQSVNQSITWSTIRSHNQSINRPITAFS